VAYRWLLGLARVLELTTRWVLQNVPTEVKTADIIEENIEGLAVLRRNFDEIVTGPERDVFRRRVEEIKEVGAEQEFAESLITLRFLDQLLEVLRVAKETGSDPVETARAFYRVSEMLRVPWLRSSIFEAAGDDRWEQRAAQALAGDLTRAHHRLVVQVMRLREDQGDVSEAAEELVQWRRREVERFRSLLEEIRGEERMTLSGLSVAVRELTLLSERLQEDAGDE